MHPLTWPLRLGDEREGDEAAGLKWCRAGVREGKWVRIAVKQRIYTGGLANYMLYSWMVNVDCHDRVHMTNKSFTRRSSYGWR